MMTVKDEIRVVLADDHAMFRDYLKQFIKANEVMTVVGDVNDGMELLGYLVKLDATHASPDLAIIDISMPYMGGIMATAKIKSVFPDLKILVLSMHEDAEYVREALAAGANGYLLKMNVAENLFPAIETIHKGESYLPSFFINDPVAAQPA